MKRLPFIAILFVILLYSCSEDEIPLPTPKPVPFPTDKVNFSDLKVGQKTVYHRYETVCGDLDNQFYWFGDTLTVEVIESDGQLMLKESLTPYSTTYLQGGFQDPFLHPVIPSEAHILLPERWASALFFFYANDTLHLNTTERIPLKQENCLIELYGDPFIGNDIGWIDEFTVGPLRIEDKTAVSCEPFFNLDAYLIYDENQLYMSHVTTLDPVNPDPDGQIVRGWIVVE